jgi:hypothetical protein
VQCCIENMAVGISSLEVVPFPACPNLVLGACRNGATSDGRNPQTYSLATETTEYLFFRLMIP